MPGLVPGIHVVGISGETWMAGTSPAMTRGVSDLLPDWRLWLWVLAFAMTTDYAASMRLNPFHIAVAAPEVSTGKMRSFW
jgi:hypothetical protein